MKNKLTYFVLFNLIVLSSFAQISKTYYNFSGNQTALDLVNCSDGGYLILSSGFILRVEENGGLIWKKPINYFAFMAQETDGGYYIVGHVDSSDYDLGYLAKVDKQGSFLWGKKFKASQKASFRYIKRLSNADLILSLRHYYLGSMPNYKTIRTDSLGNTIWSRGTMNVETSSIVELVSNDIVIIGSDYRENYPPYYPETMWPSKIKYSSNGTQLSWISQSHMDWTRCTASVSDGVNYFIATSNLNYSIFKMGESSIQWTNYFGNLNYNSACTDSINLYLTGSSGDPNWSDMFVISITGDGDFISKYIDSTDYNHHGQKVIIDNDYLVILGHTEKFSNSGFNLCLTKIPIQYILTSNDEIDKKNHSCYRIYPNPTSNMIHFEDLYPNQQKKVNIYNMLGKLELSKENLYNFIDVTELNKGIYLIEISCNSDKKIARFIKK